MANQLTVLKCVCSSCTADSSVLRCSICNDGSSPGDERLSLQYGCLRPHLPSDECSGHGSSLRPTAHGEIPPHSPPLPSPPVFPWSHNLPLNITFACVLLDLIFWTGCDRLKAEKWWLHVFTSLSVVKRRAVVCCVVVFICAHVCFLSLDSIHILTCGLQVSQRAWRQSLEENRECLVC